MNKVKLESTNNFNVEPNLEELNKIAQEAFKKDKLSIAPAGATFKDNDKGTYSPVVDALQIAIDIIAPSADDLEVMLVSVIGCVDTLGPVYQGVYGIFISRSEKDGLSKEDIKGVIDERMAAFKKEMNKVIDEKIEKSEGKAFKTICENAFQGIVESSLEMLMDNLTELKKKLLKGEDVKPSSSILISVRHKFDTLRSNIKALFPLFRDPKVVKYAYNEFIQITYMYAICLTNLMCYWHQYGFPPECARGTPKIEGVVKETHSYRMKLHLNIHRNLKVLQDNLNGDEKDIANIGKLLECDPILYPIPVIKAKLVIPPNDYGKRSLDECKKLTVPTTKIDVSQRATPFIFRVDGAAFTGEPYKESRTGFPRQVFTNVEPVTGCIGGSLNGCLGMHFELSEKKYVSVRLFIMQHDLSNLPEENETDSDGFYEEIPCNDTTITIESLDYTETKNTLGYERYSDYTETKNKLDYESGCLKDPSEFNKAKTGFYIFKKSSKPIEYFRVDVKSSGRLLMMELVISDK